MLQQNQGVSYWNGCRSVDDIVLPDGCFSVSPASLQDFEASAPGLPFDFGCGGIYKMRNAPGRVDCSNGPLYPFPNSSAIAAATTWRQHSHPFSDPLVNNVPVYKHEILKHGSHCHSREPSTGHLAPQNCSSGQVTGASQPNHSPSTVFYRGSPRPPLQLTPIPAPTLPSSSSSSHRQEDPPLGTSPDWMNFMTSTSLQHLDETEPRFQYVLTASTSPAVKLDEESLTYLNQGQSYELKLKRLPNHCSERFTKSLIRVIFHERRLQFTEREQMELWKIAHPGERILDLDVPISYGLFNLRMDSNNVNCFEFTWDTELEAAVYIRINCISTEFTAKKHGGEKGVPFRIQVETYSTSSGGGKEDQLVHCASCQVKVFKPKGADRKNKTDRDKIEKISDSEKDKYQPSFECTIFAEISPEQVHQYLDQLQKQLETGQLSGGHSIKEENQRPTSDNSCLFRSVCGQTLADSSSRLSDIESPRDDVLASDTTGSMSLLESLSPSATSLQVSQWLQLNRFSNYAHTFQNFSGADILRLSREDLIELCGMVDGIRLNNALHVRRVRPCLTMHVLIQPLKRSCSIRDDSILAARGSCLNISSSSTSRCWSPNSCNSPSSILSSLQSNGHPDLDQPCLSPLSPAPRCTSSVQDVDKFHSFNLSSKRAIATEDDDVEVEYSLVKRRCESNGKASCDFVFHAVHLEFLTKDNLLRCLANLFRLQYSCVSELCLQMSSGILVYVSDSVVQNLPDMSRYIATATEDDRNSGFYRISLQTMYLTCSNFYENDAHTQPS